MSEKKYNKKDSEKIAEKITIHPMTNRMIHSLRKD